jgi:TolB-like protein/DNA-binding winged helix-turn-helix (wHTH) protein/tetratricopeptide (TPR) repeat protein
MGEPPVPATVYRLGLFEFDPQSRELRKQGIRIRLQGQPVEILAMLLARPGEVVTREELQNRLWPGDTFVDFDRSLNAAVKRLRAALGDSAETPRFIETLSRRGYRFIAPVDAVRSPRAVAAVGPLVEPSAIQQAESAPRRWLRPHYRPWIALVAVAVTSVSLTLFWGNIVESVRRDSSARRIQSLLVLPLKSLSGDPEQEYFANGLTDALNAGLAGVSALRVISQTSSMLYKGTDKPLSRIARELNVDGIVEGSVLRSGDRIRINVALVQPSIEKRIWGQTYERDVRDVIKLQNEVTRAIVDEIRTTLTPGEQARLTRVRSSNPEAHIAYAKGRFFWNMRTEVGLRKAVEYFEQAIEKDPGYALAYAGLADSWVPRAWYAYLPANEAFPHARRAVAKALELEPDLVEAHTTLAFIKLYYEWDWDAAERQFLLAIKLNPNYANAHHWYAEYLSLAGRHEAAIREAERARELDPISSIINVWVGSRYFFAQKYDLAIAQYRSAVELDSNFVPARLALGQAYVQKKMFHEAITELEKAVSLSGGSPVYAASLAHAYGVAGRKTDALRIIDDLEELARRRHVASFDLAIGWLGLGDNKRALASLEKALEERSPRLLFLSVEPRFDPLRSDAGFQALIKRVGR